MDDADLVETCDRSRIQVIVETGSISSARLPRKSIWSDTGLVTCLVSGTNLGLAAAGPSATFSKSAHADSQPRPASLDFNLPGFGSYGHHRRPQAGFLQKNCVPRLYAHVFPGRLMSLGMPELAFQSILDCRDGSLPLLDPLACLRALRSSAVASRISRCRSAASLTTMSRVDSISLRSSART